MMAPSALDIPKMVMVLLATSSKSTKMVDSGLVRGMQMLVETSQTEVLITGQMALLRSMATDSI